MSINEDTQWVYDLARFRSPEVISCGNIPRASLVTKFLMHHAERSIYIFSKDLPDNIFLESLGEIHWAKNHGCEIKILVQGDCSNSKFFEKVAQLGIAVRVTAGMDANIKENFTICDGTTFRFSPTEGRAVASFYNYETAQHLVKQFNILYER